MQFVPDVGFCECVAAQASVLNTKVNHLAMMLTDVFREQQGW